MEKQNRLRHPLSLTFNKGMPADNLLRAYLYFLTALRKASDRTTTNH